MEIGELAVHDEGRAAAKLAHENRSELMRGLDGDRNGFGLSLFLGVVQGEDGGERRDARFFTDDARRVGGKEGELDSVHFGDGYGSRFFDTSERQCAGVVGPHLGKQLRLPLLG